ncbi:serine/threonine protein kinase-like protein [Amniculicola lignicola CBS 123094]|uniref:non-specific serine/threonine protein kinase n=1 Tax=Amniculicola lignicola CBS 123094 TaxID=1392246 RepID=A0A6A5WJJ8_9PLEO|nr:serine/threonine protein kinase-like protein [Amniculicola lignicola CBS 123094]
MPRRAAPTAATRAGRSSKRAKTTTQKEVFTFKRPEWMVLRNLYSRVHLMARRTAHRDVVVKKIVNRDSPNKIKPYEIRALDRIGKMNRLLQPLACLTSGPDDMKAHIIFPYLPLGDMSLWKELNFNQRNHKAVPESFVWRMFSQMAQALAFLHAELGPSRSRKPILHRDIKPMNVLVASNGTTYPSFILHDFGLALVSRPQIKNRPSLAGTYVWQPPERPLINTTAADVWALGALVHYLAVDDAPVESIEEFRAAEMARHGGAHPPAAGGFQTPMAYYQSRVPRNVTPINLSRSEQEEMGVTTRGRHGQVLYNHTYSDELNGWMSKCLRASRLRRPSAGVLVEEMIPVAMEMLKAAGGQNALVDMDVSFGG